MPALGVCSTVHVLNKIAVMGDQVKTLRKLGTTVRSAIVARVSKNLCYLRHEQVCMDEQSFDAIMTV